MINYILILFLVLEIETAFFLLFPADTTALTNTVPSNHEERDIKAFDWLLALRWAPVHYQATTSRDEGPEADFLTRWDYDGDMNPANNWDHLTSTFDHKNRGHAYYAVVESCTHWFVTYLFYHARDWNAGFGYDSEHENDTEGLLALVRKDGSRFGSFEAIITRFHGDLYTYTPTHSTLRAGKEPITGSLSFQTVSGLPDEIENHGINHPKTYQDPEGHGLKACCVDSRFSGRPHQDGVVYFPSTAAVVEPPSPAKHIRREAQYNLSPLNHLWSVQLKEARIPSNKRVVFTSWGSLRGDDSGSCGARLFIPCRQNSADMPWYWIDDDDPIIRGDLALHPARLVDFYFDNLGQFSYRYQRNFYLHDLQLADFGSDDLPIGFPTDNHLAILGGKVEQILPRLFNKLTNTCP